MLANRLARKPADTSDAAATGGGEASDAAAAPMILESAWRVVEIAGEPVADGVSPTLAIDAEGGISGSGGCNRYFGSATIDGEQITMGGIGATRMACPEPAMGEEQRYLQALDAVASWQLEADELTLADDAGHRPRPPRARRRLSPTTAQATRPERLP